MSVATARLSIRPTTWRGEDGFLIYGRDAGGRRVSIFTTTRGSAEHIRERVKAGHDIAADFEPREVAPKPYTRKDHRLAAAAELAVRLFEPGVLDDPQAMPLCTLQRLAEAFLGAKPPRIADPEQVIDLLHAYQSRVPGAAAMASRLREAEAALMRMRQAATIPTAVYERYLEAHGWVRNPYPCAQSDLSHWIKPETSYPGVGPIGVSLPLHEETWLFARRLADRPFRLYVALRAIAAVDERPVDAVLADLLELAAGSAPEGAAASTGALHHRHILGPTAEGRSALLANMALDRVKSRRQAES